MGCLKIDLIGQKIAENKGELREILIGTVIET
jgi:hypothetical protein